MQPREAMLKAKVFNLKVRHVGVGKKKQKCQLMRVNYLLVFR